MSEDVKSWLERLGLGQYVDAFAQGAIDWDVFPSLDHEILKEIGVKPPGDRLRILNAIKSLENETAAESFDAPSHVPSEPAVGLIDEAERRQLTVMFCDLVGSTALSASMDPEEYRGVLASYQTTAASAIKRYDGYIARYMGDGLLVYFGYPRAHEDDAERAIRTGIDIIDEVTHLSVGGHGDLQVRIGVSTGVVVVGDIVGEGASEERAVVGDAPNLAARLQAEATPDAIYLSDATRRLVEGRFELKLLGTKALQGFAQPTSMWQVIRERVVDSRFEARTLGEMSPMFGREHELGLVLERWRQARSGEGQMVILTGEAGIGKSRITQAVLDSVSRDTHTRITFQCSPFHADSTLHPAIEHIRRAAGFGPGDPVEEQLDKLEELIGQAVDDARSTAPVLAALVGLDGVARYGPIQMTPQQQRQRTLQALREQLLGLATKKPCLFIVEDAHWIDPTTLELLSLCLDQIDNARALMLITARPTFVHHYGGHPIVTQLTLNRLGRAQISEIVEQLSQGRSMPPELVEVIAEKTDGVPLFVEELTKTVLESDFLRLVGDAYVLDGKVQTLSIPTSLHDSLMARLDRLEPVKDVAQTAACIGREFAYRLLCNVLPISENELQNALAHLTEAELIFSRGDPPEATYLFKHALVRDAAYESLLKSKRQQIHASLVAALKEESETPAEILAHHADAAGFVEQALGHWQQAGDAALARSANQEAVGHLSAAVRLSKTLGDAPQWKEKELELQVTLGQALIATKGYAAEETVQAFDRGLEISEQVDDTALRLRALFGQWTGVYIRGSADGAYAEAFAAAASSQDDSGPRVVALRIQALVEIHSGNFSKALRLVDEALELYVPRAHRGLALKYGHDPKAAALNYKSWLTWLLGYPDQSDACAREALSWAKEIDHANTYGIVHCWGTVVPQVLQRRDVEVEKNALLTIEISNEHEMPLWRGWATAFLGWSRACQGHYEQGLRDMRAGMEELERSGTARLEPLVVGLYAETNSLAGRHDEALRAIEQAFDSLARTRDVAWKAELYRLRADVRKREGSASTSGVRADLEEAVKIARQQQSKSLELRASLGLTRLLMDDADNEGACHLIEPLHRSFSEGFDTPDVKQAGALLGELTS